MTAPFLRVTDVSKRYGNHSAVDGVSFDMNAGESMVVIGPSGCGKTTLLRLVSGLERPDGGEISLGGRRVAGGGRNLVPPHHRRLGFMFQDLALWPHLTVRENLEFVMGAVGVPHLEQGSHGRDTLALVRIEVLAERYPHELSGGEQQRAALARALVGRPELLLLDEPFSSLDHELRTALREELGALQRALRLTSIYVTHDRQDAAALADRIIEMEKGRKVAERAGNRDERHS
jgi:ABC-type Fe3+/spermidine/putrescine transport system ATPase subunit